MKPEEGGDDVKSSWPLCPGLHTCYNGGYKAQRTREGEPIPESRPQFGLESATRLHEAGIASNRRSARSGEYVPGPCTHRPSHHGSRLLQKQVPEPFGVGACQGVIGDWGEVVTRYPYRKVGMDHLLSRSPFVWGASPHGLPGRARTPCRSFRFHCPVFGGPCPPPEKRRAANKSREREHCRVRAESSVPCGDLDMQRPKCL